MMRSHGVKWKKHKQGGSTPSLLHQKRALSSVCVKGDQAQKHPHWVFLSLKKGTEHKNTPLSVYFCPQYVLSTKPPMLGGLCAQKGVPSMNTHQCGVFMLGICGPASLGWRWWGCGGGQLIGSRCGSLSCDNQKFTLFGLFFCGNYHSKYVVLTCKGWRGQLGL